MNIVRQATCKFCGKPIDLNHDYYRKIVEMNGKTYFWHSDTSNPQKDCWHNSFQLLSQKTVKVQAI